MTSRQDPDDHPEPAASDEPDVSATDQRPAEQPVVQSSREPGRVREFFGHRATQLIGVGLAGLLIGGGAVALHDTAGRGDPGRSGSEQGFGPGRGEGPRFERRGPRGPFPDPPLRPTPQPTPSSAPAVPTPTT